MGRGLADERKFGVIGMIIFWGGKWSPNRMIFWYDWKDISRLSLNRRMLNTFHFVLNQEGGDVDIFEKQEPLFSTWQANVHHVTI